MKINGFRAKMTSSSALTVITCAELGTHSKITEQIAKNVGTNQFVESKLHDSYVEKLRKGAPFHVYINYSELAAYPEYYKSADGQLRAFPQFGRFLFCRSESGKSVVIKVAKIKYEIKLRITKDQHTQLRADIDNAKIFNSYAKYEWSTRKMKPGMYYQLHLSDVYIFSTESYHLYKKMLDFLSKSPDYSTLYGSMGVNAEEINNRLTQYLHGKFVSHGWMKIMKYKIVKESDASYVNDPNIDYFEVDITRDSAGITYSMPDAAAINDLQNRSLVWVYDIEACDKTNERIPDGRSEDARCPVFTVVLYPVCQQQIAADNVSNRYVITVCYEHDFDVSKINPKTNLVVLVECDERMYHIFMDLIRIVKPDWFCHFNGGDFDTKFMYNRWLTSKNGATAKKVLDTRDAASRIKLSPPGNAVLTRYNSMFKQENFKVSAQDNKVSILTANIPGMLDFDIYQSLRRDKPRSKAGLNDRLAQFGLPAKTEMDIHELMNTSRTYLSWITRPANDPERVAQNKIYQQILNYCTQDSVLTAQLANTAECFMNLGVRASMLSFDLYNVMHRADVGRITVRHYIQGELKKMLLFLDGDGRVADTYDDASGGNDIDVGDLKSGSKKQKYLGAEVTGAPFDTKLKPHFRVYARVRGVTVSAERFAQLVAKYGRKFYVHRDALTSIATDDGERLYEQWLTDSHIIVATVGIDVESMYPNIMRSHNISPDTCIRPEDVEEIERAGIEVDKRAFYIDMATDKRVQMYFVAHRGDTSKMGLIPLEVHELFAMRKEIKKEMAKHKDAYNLCKQEYERTKDEKMMARALVEKGRAAKCDSGQGVAKVQMNTIYGGLGYNKSGIYREGLAATVTSMGRYYNQVIYECIKRQGYAVLYRDTDSNYAMLSLECKELAALGEKYYLSPEIPTDDQVRQLYIDAMPTCRKMADSIVAVVNAELASKNYGLDYMKVGYDDELLMSVTLSMQKKYCAMKFIPSTRKTMVPLEVSGDDRMFTKGTVLDKLNTCKFVNDIYREVLSRILDVTEFRSRIDIVAEVFDSIYSRKTNFADFVMKKRLRKPDSGKKGNIQMELFKARMEKLGYQMEYGKTYECVQCVVPEIDQKTGDRFKLKGGDRIFLREYAEVNKLAIDYRYYIDGDLLTALSELCYTEFLDDRVREEYYARRAKLNTEVDGSKAKLDEFIAYGKRIVDVAKVAVDRELSRKLASIHSEHGVVEASVSKKVITQINESGINPRSSYIASVGNYLAGRDLVPLGRNIFSIFDGVSVAKIHRYIIDSLEHAVLAYVNDKMSKNRKIYADRILALAEGHIQLQKNEEEIAQEMHAELRQKRLSTVTLIKTQMDTLLTNAFSNSDEAKIEFANAVIKQVVRKIGGAKRVMNEEIASILAYTKYFANENPCMQMPSMKDRIITMKTALESINKAVLDMCVYEVTYISHQFVAQCLRIYNQDPSGNALSFGRKVANIQLKIDDYRDMSSIVADVTKSQ
jgi:DNA polymerase elongation subunit (family B)